MDPAGRLQFTKCETEIRHYRRFADVSSHPEVKQEGVTKLYVSASGQFGEAHIQRIADKAREIHKDFTQLWFVDLRAERHLFINGKPAVWKADQEKVGESAKTILEDENQRISKIGEKVLVGDKRGGDGVVDVEKAISEQDLVKSYGYQYIRFPMVEHEAPTPECVDNLVQFIVNHPNAWIHYHCYVSKRSTTASVINDMLYNASNVDLKSIVARARAIGGADLMKHSDKSSVIEFLQNFHKYCQTEKPAQNPKAKAWSEWIKQQTI